VAPLDPEQVPTRVRVGNRGCRLPYEASRLNISAMSFGALSSNAVEALNEGARRGGFAHDTGEGGISDHHLLGGDLIWEIGTGYFGCRDEAGGFDPDAFARNAARDAVKMIELKLSQGAKPGGGGILPGEKVNRAIARARGVPVGRTVHSPVAHSTFSTPLELMDHLARLRELANGKPVGFKLCLGRHTEFMAIVKAMLERDFTPDFITLDGGEGGTGAAPLELSNAIGAPLTDALIFVRNALAGAGLREDIRIIACGKIIDGFDIARRIAVGADLCGSARGMMFALGCIQARRCHSNRCPTGITTNDPMRANGLVVSDKAPRVERYHATTLAHFRQVLATTGLAKAEQLCPELLYRRVSPHEAYSYAEIYPNVPHRALLAGSAPAPYQGVWNRADPRRFGAPAPESARLAQHG